uniref:UPAR/Ly6 domain-containing protein n=1 Tax=Castor canadensis TaxID=51338 RepID=A0A8C0VXR0_CASCN
MDSSHTMKTSVLILLMALLCAERAQGLRCYKCFGSLRGKSCQPTTCSSPNSVCVTQVLETIVCEFQRLVNKFCLPFCPEKYTSIKNMPVMGTILNTQTSCCTDDLCNGDSGGRSPHPTFCPHWPVL